MSINENGSQFTRLITLLLENAQSKHPQDLSLWAYEEIDCAVHH